MKQAFRKHFVYLIFIVLLFLSGWILAFPPNIIDKNQLITLIIGILAIGLWATGIIPEHITALLFFSASMLLSIAQPEAIFSGFSSSAFWLVFAGLIIGIAIKNTGLGKHIATLLVTHLEANYLRLISGVVAIGVLFSFLMPSAMARMVLLIPIILLIASHFGFQPGSNGRTGIVLAAAMGAFFPAFSILPANVANMVLSGMFESQFNQSLLYGEYLLLHFPILGFLKALVIIGLIIWLYPDRIKESDDSELNNQKAWTKSEYLLALLLGMALLLWMSDFIHHISPAWIALVVAIIILFPKVAIVSTTEFNQQINYASLFFVAGIIGFGVVIAQSGLGEVLAKELLNRFPLNPEAPFINYMLLNLVAILTAIATTSPSVPAVLTPLAEPLSQATGLPLKTVIMTQVIGYSTTIFPYQTAPILIAMNLAGEKLTTAVKFSAILAIFTIFVLLPVNYLWWQFLGKFN